MTPTFVLIHGSDADSSTRAPLQRESAPPGRRWLAVDLPGHGFDAAVPSAYRVPDADSPPEAHGTSCANFWSMRRRKGLRIGFRSP